MKKLSSFSLKIIALVTMTIDHIGYFLFPGVEWLRIIGRISFPIYCFLSAQAYLHTKDRRAYFIRMFLFGVVISLFKFIFANFYECDVFMTLALGFLIIVLLEKKQYLLAGLVLLAGTFINCEYSWYGLLLPSLFYYLPSIYYFPMLLILSFIYVETGDFFLQLTRSLPIVIYPSSDTQLFSCVSGLIIYCYNGQKGPNINKYFFYLYYPIHVIIINIIGMVMK